MARNRGIEAATGEWAERVTFLVDCLQRHLSRMFGIEEHCGCAVEIGDIGFKDIGRDIVPGHHLFIRVTACTKFG